MHMREMFLHFAAKPYNSNYIIKGKAGANRPFSLMAISDIHYQKPRTPPPMMKFRRQRFVPSASNGLYFHCGVIHSTTASCSGLLLSNSASKNARYPPTPPTSSGGASPAPSINSAVFLLYASTTLLLLISCFQLSPKSPCLRAKVRQPGRAGAAGTHHADGFVRPPGGGNAGA